MRPTQQLRSIGGLSIAVLVGAALTAQPIALIGATTLLATVIVIQWQATSEFTTVNDQLTVDVAAAEQRTVPDGTIPITITATLQEPTAASVSLSVSYGPGVDGPTDTLTIEPGTTRTDVVHDVTFPVAGRFDLPAITCTLEDSSGSITETFERETTTTVTLAPPAPTNIHIGQRGQQRGGQYGEHRSDTTGSGIEVAELREYRPSDSVGTIDWKATARLNEPHVREFEAETTRQMTLLVDARKSLQDGPRGRSKLAYLREVALGFVELAEQAADPVSLSVIDTEGVHIHHAAAETTSHYRRLRWALQNLAPAQAPATTTPRTARRGPAEASRLGQRLAEQQSSFATTLRPYLSEPGSYIDRLAEDPLFAAVRQSVDESGHNGWTVLFTDDTDPRRTIEAAKIAGKNDGVVTVFITPSVAFSSQGGDPTTAYEEYIDFEEFRRELDAIPRVTAYEVAPEARLRAILAAGSGQAGQTVTGGDA